MKVEVEESGRTKRKLRIEIPAAEVDEKLKSELGKLQRDLKMPGFRKGKVPAEVVRKKFAGSVRREVAERIVRESCMDALRQQDLRPIAPPEIRDLRYEEGEPLSFNATVEIWPEVQLNPWRGLKVKREIRPVAEQDVQDRLEVLRQMHAELVPVERPASRGDFVIVDYDVFDEEDQPLEGRGVRNNMIELGSEGLVKEFSEEMVGAKAGENRTIRVTFPEDGAHPDVAGKALKFWVKLNAVKEKRVPELDDDFAKELGEFDRLEDVREKVEISLKREAQLEADQRVRERLVDRVIEDNPFDPPESMVTGLLEAIVEDAEKHHRGATPFDRERAREALKPVAIRHSRRFVVLREIAKRESLTVSSEEVDSRIQVLANRTQQTPEEVRRKIEADGTMQEMEGDLLEEKVLNLLVETAEVENAETQENYSKELGTSE